MIDSRPQPVSASVFEFELELPDRQLTLLARRLIGFPGRYQRLRAQMRLLVDPERLAAWSQRFYGDQLPLLDVVRDAHPLALFHGDVGCGKTATAKCIANELARDLGERGVLRALSTRVRGSGYVAQMSELINEAFDEVIESSANELSFLLIDEADSLAETRAEEQTHHEDKVGVNTLIQRMNELVSVRSRVYVFLCTNRLDAIDPALLRRSYVESFDRPTYEERAHLLRLDLAGTGISEAVIAAVARLTGPDGNGRAVGFSYSDMRHRLLLQFLATACPRQPLDARDLIELARRVQPSPTMADLKGRK